MKILYLTPGVFDKGGISRYDRFQIQALRELLGVDNVTVVSLLGPSQTARDFETNFLVSWHGTSSQHPTWRDIIHFIEASWRSGNQRKADLVWAAHINFSAFSWLLAHAISARNVVQVYGREVWTKRFTRPDIHWGMKNCDALISDCHFTANYISAMTTTPPKTTVIWDCVDTEKFYPKQPDRAVWKKYNIPNPSKYFNILTLGRINQSTDYKGYTRLLKVFRNLPDTARLIFGGGGDLVNTLMRQAQNYGVDDRVAFTGLIEDDHLPDIYRSASVFCLIGDRGVGRGEGIPLTPLEAGACGIPILVGNQDGSKEAVDMGLNGFALDPFDLKSIENHLKTLIANPVYISRMGKAAYERVISHHSYSIFKKRIQDFLVTFMG